MEAFALKRALDNVRAGSPLVHNITNYVTVNDCANALLAIGASPIMSDEPADVEDITSICGGLTLNIGTLNERSIEGMFAAGERSSELGHPIVLDPVGAGASALRTRVAGDLLDKLAVSVIRGNMSEMKALAGGAAATRGVDVCPDDAVTEDNLAAGAAFARDFAAKTGAVVAITGAIDIVADADRAFAIRNEEAQEHAAPEKMTVLVVEPMKEPYVKEIDPDLHSLQAEVGGDIGATYPYSDPVALVCNDEGKLIGLDLNRGLRDEDGEIYDIVAGTFLVVGLGEEDFASLSPELIQKYTEQFKTPERFMQINGNIVVLPVPAEKQDLAYLPDRFETGERVQTPRGSFQVTAMSREQMEAAGYGVHHISDDGKYLIMGNGTRAFAVAAEQPEKDNPLRTAEMTLEDDYGMIDGVINNGRRGEELEKAQEYAERTTPEKPSIRERLEDAKRECAEHKPPEGKKPGRDVPEHDCL